MDSWMPVTPKKPIPARSNPVAVDRYGRPLPRENWQELAGFPVESMQEMPNYNRAVHNLNPIGQAGRNEGYYGGSNFGLVERSQKINQIAASYAQSLCNGSAGRNNNSLADFLAIKNAAAFASANRSNGRSTSMANRPLIPNLNYQVENWTESNSSNLMIHNQAHCSGSNLLSNNGICHIISPDGLPIAYQSSYKLNSAPRIEADAALSVTSTSPYSTVTQELLKLQNNQLLTRDFSRTEADVASSVTTTLPPVTPGQLKLQDNWLSARENLSVDVSSSQEKDKQENFVTIFGNGTVQHMYDEHLQKVVSSTVISFSTAVEEKKDTDNVNDQGIDLNKTPQQKPPKRRKHRPKVIVEGKPKRTPKTATPKTMEKPGGKRKYVRRKGLKESATQRADILRENTDPSGGAVAKSCRRVLNFNLEKIGDKSQGEGISQHDEMQQRYQRTFNLKLDSQAKALDSRTDSRCGTKSTMMIGQQNGLPVENQQPGTVGNQTHQQPETVCNQTLSFSQMLANYLSTPERQACPASLPPRKDMHMENLNVIASNVTDPCQKSNKSGYTPIQPHICAEGTGQTVFQAKTNLGKLEMTRQPMPPSTPQSAPKTSSNLREARGSKREYSHAIEQSHPHALNSTGSSLLYQAMFQMDGCYRNGDNVGPDCSEIHKKKKIENGLHASVNGEPSSFHVIKDCSIQVQTKWASDINGNGFSLQGNNYMNPHSGRYNIAKMGNGGANELNIDCYARSMTSGYNLPNQHNYSEQHSCTEKMRETNRLTSVLNFTSFTASEKCNQLPPTPPGRAPAPGDGLASKTCCNNGSAKQNVEHTLAKSVSSRMDQMLPEQREDLHDHQQYSAKIRGPPIKQIYPIPMDEIIHRFKGLNLNGKANHVHEQEQNAIVPYKPDGTIVPYQGFEFIKKRKPRPKVDLDPETNRIWNLLMGKEGSEGLEEMDDQKEKWWEEERRVFQGRADSFIARMHLVQGDRRFSKWKGSVVDSVIGVFLTQNVSDHLSSSAFMSLAARFPLKSNNRTTHIDGTNILVEEPEVCELRPNDTVQWNEKVLTHPLSSQSSMSPHELTEHWRENETSGVERTSLPETYSHSLEEEVISSQDSFSSSILQGNAGIKSYSGSNSETEDPTSGNQANQDHGSTSSLQEGDPTLFQDIYSCINERSLFQEGYGHGHKLSNDTENSQQDSGLDSIENFGSSLSFTQLLYLNSPQNHVPLVPSGNNQPHMTSYSELLEGSEIHCGECISSLPSTASGFPKAKDADYSSRRYRPLAEDVSETTVQQNGIPLPEEMPTVSPHALLREHSMQQQNVSQPGSSAKYNETYSDNISPTEPINLAKAPAKLQHVPNCPEVAEKTCNVEERISVVNKLSEDKVIEQNSREQVISGHKAHGEANPNKPKSKKGKADGGKKIAIDWDKLRKQVQSNGRKKERSKDTMDSLDYEAIRCAHVKEISDAIKERGMNNMLAERIKEFLNRLVEEHGRIDLEWLRDVPPDKAKDYLLSIRGLGLKSVECVRLLTLHHLAFPVDTNVGRIAVRLGWVPLQPLPESLQLHLLELYPILESIQKYLWPRLCKLDQRTLYELHYQLITFGKVFCTKSKPNCNACPMRGECRHFASAFASARLALPGPEEKDIVSSTVPTTAEKNPALVINPVLLPPPAERSLREAGCDIGKCEPIIEEPSTPEQECTEISESDIEDKFYEDPDEIPTIKLNIEEFTVNLQNYMQQKMELQEGDMSKALVALNPEAASIPVPKLKNVSRLRTEHHVYQLPDSHPLLNGMDRREPDDPSPYLLAIWTPGETANSIQPPEKSCGSQESGNLCNEKTCYSCNSVREANSQTVRGTLLVPCRTAMRGSFPLNGTYFQVNEVFADHESSLNPIDVPREWLWNLPRRIVYFGTSVSTIFKGLSTEGIQYCFWKGFVCVRGFDQKSRAPRPLMARLHFPASKLVKTKKESKR